MDPQRHSRWQPTRRQLLWTSGLVAVFVLISLILIGYRYGITLWDWIKLLIVPAVIAGGGLWFTRQQREREVELADRRAQDEALQAYLDQIGDLLLEKDRPLRQSKARDEVRTLARARTLTVLRRLDSQHKASVLQFLHESGLIAKNRVVVDLGGSDLIGAYLSQADLVGADLSGAYLAWANLRWANLSEANLRGAAGMTNEQLEQQTKFLEGTTMPNGQKYEDWLKIRGHRAHGENGGTS